MIDCGCHILLPVCKGPLSTSHLGPNSDITLCKGGLIPLKFMGLIIVCF